MNKFCRNVDINRNEIELKEFSKQSMQTDL